MLGVDADITVEKENILVSDRYIISPAIKTENVTIEK